MIHLLGKFGIKRQNLCSDLSSLVKVFVCTGLNSTSKYLKILIKGKHLIISSTAIHVHIFVRNKLHECLYIRGLTNSRSIPARLLGLKVEYHRGHGCMSLVSVVCCQVQIYTSGLSLAYRSPTECGVSECDREASIMKRSWPTRSC